MGVIKLWATLDDEGIEGKRVNVFEIASEHFEKTKRPYRIAVDTPYWLFKNLDEEAVENIRQLSTRASNPNEKAILYRLIRSDCHGIKFCLVFDGPNRPTKRGKKLTTAAHDLINQRLGLLKEAAYELGFECWDAPAEAEAECANMLCHDIVDAIWTEDSDAFVFRAENLLRFHYEKPGHKDNVMATKYRISDIRETIPNMDWRGALLFAVLVGGDYAVGGLHGCGQKLALKAIKKGFGALLVNLFKINGLKTWRQKFQGFLDKERAHVSLPVDFPSAQVLNQYISPRVSSPDDLRAKICWEIPVNHLSLKQIITRRFNFGVQEYIRWVVRMLVVRRLQAGPGSGVDELKLEFVRDVCTKESGQIDLSKVSFLIGSVVPNATLLETWGVKETIDEARKKPYVHMDRVQCDIPDSIIKFACPDLLESKKARKPKTSKIEAQKETHTSDRNRDSEAPPMTLAGEALGQPGMKRKRGERRNDGANRLTALPTNGPKTKITVGATRASNSFTISNEEGEKAEDDEFPDISELGRARGSKAPLGIQHGRDVPQRRAALSVIRANATPKARDSMLMEKQASPAAGQSSSHPIELDD